MIPITIVAGYLGAGKTTFINKVLAETKSPLGVLVNDFGDLAIDHDLIQNDDGLTYSLNNGCVCCKLNDDTGAALESIKNKDISGVLLEASGVAIPIKVANYGLSWPGFSLNGILSLVDGQSVESLLDDKYVKTTVRDQLVQADRIVLNRHKKNIPKRLLELNSDIYTDREIQNYPEFIQGSFFSKKGIDNFQENHYAFKTSSLVSKESINKDKLKDFLSTNPHIHRAKGWIRDQQHQSWLVQMNKGERKFIPCSYQTQNRMIFISTESINFQSQLINRFT